MKRILFIILLIIPLISNAQDIEHDDFGLWGDIQVNHSWDKMYCSLRAEYRSKNNSRQTDCWFLRPTIGCKIAPWLKADIAYDYMNKQQGLYHQGLASLTATLKQENLSVSVRERYVFAYSAETRLSSHLLRSQLKVQYNIPNSIFRPYLAVEMFTWRDWQKTRHYAGTLINISANQSIDLFYMYYTFKGKPAEHVIGVGYNITL